MRLGEHKIKAGIYAHRSVAILSFAIELRSSLLVFADRLVIGVLASLLIVESGGVDPVAMLLPLADCLAAFSARRFCLDAEGAMDQYGWRG